VLEARGFEILPVADDRVAVGPALERDLADPDERVPVGRVVDPLAPLLPHGLALVLEILVRHRERAHPIRFQPEAEPQLMGWKGLVVVRAVLARRAVERAAPARDVPEV